MDQVKKLDRRIARTRRMLSASLIELALEKGYDQISIRDLTQRADIGYATFFRHYKSKDELATYCLLAVIPEMICKVQSAETLHQESLAVFTVLDKHRDTCLFGLSLPRDHPVLKPFWEKITHWVVTLYSARNEEAIPLEVSVNHIINSALELLRWWLTDGQDYNFEQMAIIYSELVVRVTEAVALDRQTKSLPDIAPD